MKLDNIDGKSGLLLNIKGNQRVLFDINGKLQFLNLENNLILRITIDTCSDISTETCPNGLVYYNNGFLKFFKTPKNYKINELGLIRRNQIFRAAVNCHILPIMATHFYIMIEKELKPYSIKGGPNVNRNFYYLTYRTEE